jgi:hypothetical protein
MFRNYYGEHQSAFIFYDETNSITAMKHSVMLSSNYQSDSHECTNKYSCIRGKKHIILALLLCKQYFVSFIREKRDGRGQILTFPVCRFTLNLTLVAHSSTFSSLLSIKKTS